MVIIQLEEQVILILDMQHLIGTELIFLHILMLQFLHGTAIKVLKVLMILVFIIGMDLVGQKSLKNLIQILAMEIKQIGLMLKYPFLTI